MNTLYKIVLINFGCPNEPDKEINGDRLSEVLAGEIRFHSCEISKIPKVGERFMVRGAACDDQIFNCLRVYDDKGLNKIERYDYVIIANFVARLAFEEDKNEVVRLREFMSL